MLPSFKNCMKTFLISMASTSTNSVWQYIYLIAVCSYSSHHCREMTCTMALYLTLKKEERLHIYGEVNTDFLLMITSRKWCFLALSFLTDCSISSLICGVKKTE